jgi:hypothetical protein
MKPHASSVSARPPRPAREPVYADDAWQAGVRLERWKLDAPAPPGPVVGLDDERARLCADPAALAEVAEIEARIAAAIAAVPPDGSGLSAARAFDVAVIALLAAPPPRTPAGRQRLARAVGALAEDAYEAWRDAGQRDPDQQPRPNFATYSTGTAPRDDGRLYVNPLRRCARWMAWANLERSGTLYAPLPYE